MDQPYIIDLETGQGTIWEHVLLTAMKNSLEEPQVI